MARMVLLMLNGFNCQIRKQKYSCESYIIPPKASDYNPAKLRKLPSQYVAAEESCIGKGMPQF